MADRWGRKHPHTSYTSLFVAMDQLQAPKVAELHGVRLKKDGFDVVVDLEEIDDRMQVCVRVLKNKKPIFLNFDCYEMGYKGADGTVYGVDDDGRFGGEQ